MRGNTFRRSKTCLVYSIILFVIGISLYYSNIDSKRYPVEPVRFSGLMCILFSAALVFLGLCLWVCETTPQPNISRAPQIHMISVQESVIPPREPQVDYSQDLPPSYEEIMKYHVGVPINSVPNGASVSSPSIVMAVQENIGQDNLNLNHFTVLSQRSPCAK